VVFFSFGFLFFSSGFLILFLYFSYSFIILFLCFLSFVTGRKREEKGKKTREKKRKEEKRREKERKPKEKKKKIEALYALSDTEIKLVVAGN
jgi:predicted membrane protein